MKLNWICDQPHSSPIEYIYNKYYPNSPHNSKHMFDIYSFTHTFWSMFVFVLLRLLLSKINFYITDLQLAIVVFLITSYFEIHENQEEQIIKYRRIEIDANGHSSYRGDTVMNIIGDIISNSIGIFLAYYLLNSSGGKYSNYVIPTLILIFGIITKVVGVGYWLEFFEFMGVGTF